MPAVAFHCQAKVISRTRGQSAVACAAYRARAVLEDERYGKVQDFSRIKGLEFVWHAAPADAPAWAKDVGQTWNAVERVEVRRNSTLAREYVAAFPHQLSAEQREWMLKDFVREEFTRKGLIATAVIHAPDKGDERNFHSHVMVAERPVDAEGWSKHKDRSLQSKETLAEVREKWAELGARQLERAGFEIEAERWRHGHKSLKQQEAAALERGDLAYAEQVRDREPTTHVGHVATAIERKGRVSERGELNREVEARNVERKEIEVDLAAVRQELERLVLEPDAERQAVEEQPAERRAEDVPIPAAEAKAEIVLAPEEQTSETKTPEREADSAVVDVEAVTLEVDSLPSVGELSRSIERSVDKVEGVAAKGLGVALDAVQAVALGAEEFWFGGALRKAPGGAEYVPPAAAGPPPIAAPEKSQTRKDKEYMGNQDENAHREANVQANAERSPVSVNAEMIARMRRDLEQQREKRKELYRDRDDDWDRDRER